MDIVTLALAKKGAKSYTDTKLGAITGDFNYLGSVATMENLPLSANTGDEYTVGNQGPYVYNGTEWVAASIPGPQGEQGERGPAGQNGRDGAIQYTAGNNITIENNVISAIGGEYVVISDDVLWLSQDATHEEIMEAFGGEDAFNNKLQKLLDGMPAIVLYSDADNYIETYPCYTSLDANLLGLLEMYEDGQASIWFQKDEETNKWSVQTKNQSHYVSDVSLNNYLRKDNTSSYTPTGNYNPATKKYVDDSIASAIGNAIGGSY